MREALSTLTTRGRAFLSAGVTASVCAFVLGQDDLLRVGLFLIALPVLTAVDSASCALPVVLLARRTARSARSRTDGDRDDQSREPRPHPDRA